MSFIRFTTFKRSMLLTILISLNREIISPYSRYAKKELVYIIFISLFGRQPSFCLKCTKVNTQLLYNIHFIFLNEYVCLTIYY
jgi:hypothetical protein